MVNPALSRTFLAWSFVAVPLLFAIFVIASYGFALSHGELPFLGELEWRWYVAFGLALVSGTVCIFLAFFDRTVIRFIASVAYLFIMGSALVLIELLISCTQGACG